MEDGDHCKCNSLTAVWLAEEANPIYIVFLVKHMCSDPGAKAAKEGNRFTSWAAFYCHCLGKGSKFILDSDAPLWYSTSQTQYWLQATSWENLSNLHQTAQVIPSVISTRTRRKIRIYSNTVIGIRGGGYCIEQPFCSGSKHFLRRWRDQHKQTKAKSECSAWESKKSGEPNLAGLLLC